MLINFLVSTQDEVNIIIPILQMRKLSQGQIPSLCKSQDSVQAMWGKVKVLTLHFQERFHLLGFTLRLLLHSWGGGAVGTSVLEEKP